MKKEVTNRELLRNYKEIKIKLLSGELEEVIVPQKEGSVLKITAEKEETPFERMRKAIKKRPITYIKRPEEDLF